MKVIDLLNKKANNELMPQLIKITRIDYEVEYYLDNDFWYRSIKDDKKLDILPNILNAEVKVITNEYKQMIQKEQIIEEEKEIEEFNYFNSNKFIHTPNGMTKTDRNHLDSNFEEIRLQINNIKRELNKIKKEGK